MNGRLTDDPVIEHVDVQVYTIPTDAPEADGTIAWDSTTMVLVQARAGTTVGTGWTYGAASCGAVVSTILAPLLVGRSALDVAGCFDTMVRAVRNIGRTGIAGYAISAVDVALWDLKARLLGLPLYRLLGAAREHIDVYGSGGFTSYDERRLREQLGGWVHEQHIPRVKIKIGESWGAAQSRDLRRIAQARSAVGDAAELFVDANGGYTAKQAIRVMEAVSDADVRWLEEPVSSDDLAGLALVRGAVSADVAAGEYGGDPGYFRRLCQSGAVDCLQADASRCGGITGWLAAAAVAASFGLQISAHCAPHLHAHVALSVPNARHLEWFHDHVRIESLFFDGALDPQGGRVRPDPDAPGLGLQLRRADTEPYRAG